jgi:type IV pilus assembly protein PilA
MARTTISETIQNTGVVPGSNASAGLPSKASVTSVYLSQLEVVGGGIIKATVQGTKSSADTGIVQFAPYEADGTTAITTAAIAGGYNGSVVWKCTGSTVPAQYLPASCR